MRFGLIALAWLVCGSAAFAQHDGDIEIVLDGGNLAVEHGESGWLFPAEFPQPPDPLAFFTDEPGMEAEDGALGGGDEVGAEALSNLLFWNDAGVGAADATLRIEQGPVQLLALAGAGSLGSFAVGTADDEGGMHLHLDFSLLQPDAGNPLALVPGGPAGVYGLHLRLTSPQHGASEPLLIAFNNGLDDEAFARGAAALAAHAGVPVPEPASWMLAMLGLVALAAAQARRQA
jgi:hypothetical protein